MIFFIVLSKIKSNEYLFFRVHFSSNSGKFPNDDALKEGVKLFSSVYNSANIKNKKKQTTEQFLQVQIDLTDVKWIDLDDLDLDDFFTEY